MSILIGILMGTVVFLMFLIPVVLLKEFMKGITITINHNHTSTSPTTLPQGSPILEQPEPPDEKDRPTVNMDPFMEALQDIMLGGDDNVRER